MYILYIYNYIYIYIYIYVKDAPTLGLAYHIYWFISTHSLIDIGFFSTDTIDIELCMCELPCVRLNIN